MNRPYGEYHYTSTFTQDTKDGFAGLELHRTSQGTTTRIANVIFWDARGQFYVETFGSDVPLEVLEELITEAKKRIKTE